MSKRKTHQDYHELAKKRGFTWEGTELPKNTHTPTPWKCEYGHVWSTSYSNISSRRSGCPYCSGKATKTVADYNILAQERGFEWVGIELPKNIKTPTPWKCKNNHIWPACYNSIQQGRGCPHCSDHVPKTVADYNALAQEHGFEWIGDELPQNIQTPTPWKCKNNHAWPARYESIQQGKGCPHCSDHVPKTVADYNTLAQERGFEWVGDELPQYTKTPTPWKCKNNHIWPATYNKIQQGSGCPLCQYIINGAPTSQLQRDLCAMLAGELNHPCGPYAIDVAIYRENIPIAVEYDAWYWHAGREEHDEQRDRELIAAGWRVLRVRSNARLPTRAQLDAAIARLVAGATYAEIVLADWGEGPTFEEVRATTAPDSPWTQLTLWDLLDA